MTEFLLPEVAVALITQVEPLEVLMMVLVATVAERPVRQDYLMVNLQTMLRMLHQVGYRV